MMRIENELALLDPLLSALSATPPASPVDGQLWFFPADAAGAVWQFRYNASGSTYKWEFVGGSPLVSYYAAQDVLPTAAWTQGYPDLTLPRAGDYRFTISADFSCNANSQCYFGLWVTGPPSIIAAHVLSSNWELTNTLSDIPLTVTAGQLVRGAYYGAGASTGIKQRFLSARPVRIS